MRPAQAIMVDLASAGLSAEQLALVIELTASVAAESRPAIDKAAENKREYDRGYQRERRRNRTTSHDSADVVEKVPSEVSPENPLPTNLQIAPLSPPAVLEEKRDAAASCLQAAFPPPVGVSAEQWAAFRKQRKKALNARSYALIANKLTTLAAAGHDAGAMIDLAIERGWETVFEPKDFGPKTGSAKWVSASGYEYHGSDQAVMREAERRNDMGTYWAVKAKLSQAA